MKNGIIQNKSLIHLFSNFVFTLINILLKLSCEQELCKYEKDS